MLLKIDWNEGHISSRIPNMSESAYTGNNYIKICSESVQEIQLWISNGMGSVAPDICKDCQPGYELYENKDLVDDDERVGSAIPKAYESKTLVYYRDTKLKNLVLARASGICEGCKMPAPFNRVSTGEPYLELHHKVQLSKDGKDTVKNAVALCPNCHCKAHFG